jgi:hypothetical protein
MTSETDAVAIGALRELLLAASDATAHDKAHWERLCQAKERARQVLCRSPVPSPSMEASFTSDSTSVASPPPDIEKLREATARIALLEARLEVDHAWKMENGQLVRFEIPPEDRANWPDGIDCRDETIKLLEEQLSSLSARLREVEGALKAVKIGDVYGKPFIGITMGDEGCWSVEWPQEGLRILNLWEKLQARALTKPPGESDG